MSRITAITVIMFPMVPEEPGSVAVKWVEGGRHYGVSREFKGAEFPALITWQFDPPPPPPEDFEL